VAHGDPPATHGITRRAGLRRTRVAIARSDSRSRKTLREKYGPEFAHYRSDAKRGTVLKGERAETLDDLSKKKR